MFKKLLVFTLLVVGAFTLTACGDKGPTTEEILTMIQEAVDELDLPSSTTDDLTLPNSGVHDVEITWSSSDTDFIANDGSVTIPTKTDGDQDVTLTATLTLEDQTLTKTFVVSVAAASEYTNLELAQQAADALVLPVTGIVTGSFTPPTSGLNSATITWATSNAAVVAADGTVTRPASDAGNASVTLTATVTVNGVSVTKDIDVLVAAEEAAATFDDLATLITTSTLGDLVEFEGLVSSTFNGGYFLTDGTDVIGVYNPGSEISPAIGDKVYVKGEFAKYNTLFQISSVESEAITLAGDGTQPFTPVVSSVAALVGFDAAANPLVHGKNYTVVGTLVVGKNADGYDTLFLENGDDKVAFYYNSVGDSLDLLYDRVGVKVEIEVTYYTLHSRNGVLVTFDGTEDDIRLAPLTDAEAVVADADASTVAPAAVYDDFTLPTAGNNGTTYGTWTSDTPTVLSNTGELLVAVTEPTEVTFTATVTKNAETDDAEFTVVVVPLVTAADVLEYEVGDYFYVSGIVYEEAYYGVYITSGGGTLFVYTRDLQEEVAPGDELTLLGYLGQYSGLLQANVYDDDYVVDDTAAGTLPTPIVTTVEAAEKDVYQRGSILTVTARVTVEGDYNDVYLNGLDGGKVKVYYRSNADEIAGYDDTDGYFGFVDKWITLDIVTYQNGTVLFQGTEDDITETVKPTSDAAKVQAALDNIMLEGLDYVTEDLELPMHGEVFTGLNIVWTTVVASGDGDIAGDGTLTLGYGAETVLTLTATITLNATTLTRDFDVVIADGDDLGPKNVAFALAAEGGEVVVIQGIVSGFSNGYPVMQDPDGTAIYLYGYPIQYDLEIGDEAIVRGTRGEHNGIFQLSSTTLIELISSDNDFLVIDDVTPAELGKSADYDDYQNQVMKMELTFSSMDDGYDYFIFEGDDLDLKIDFEDCALCSELFAVGDSAVFEFVVFKVDFGSIILSNAVFLPAESTLTDAQKMTATELALSFPYQASEDLTLPTTIEPYGATIAWSSSNTAVIGNDGTVTQNAYGGAVETVTLTATISIGSETDVVLTSDVLVPPVFGLDIFFSEYIEGSSNNKALELYNPTGSAITMDGYEVRVYSNGNGDMTNPNYTYDLSGIVLNSGAVYVISNSSAVAGISAESDVTSNVTYYNGDDAVVLVKDGVIIDVIGVIGVDPGSNWTVGDGSTGEHTLVRKSAVTFGDGLFDPTQWEVYDQDTFDYIGSHTCDEPTT